MTANTKPDVAETVRRKMKLPTKRKATVARKVKRQPLDKEIENAMQVLNCLSVDAKTAGEISLMYAANRAWSQLFDFRRARTQPEKR